MVISSRKMSKRTQEPVDQWLAKEGYFRKPTPKDPTCLFRAISEQVYHTQHYHLRVRKECTEFMRKKRHLFTDSIMMSFDYYLKEMQCFTEWGGPNEIRAMSLLYKRDIIIFIGEKQICENVTNNGFKKGVMLLCHTETRQYEPVYPMAFVQSAAYCQSIVYEVVYRYMYQMPNINTVADKMLHNRTSSYRHDKFFQKGNLDIREQLIEDLYKKVKNEPDDADEAQFDWKEGPPIPYKVAKALAPDYYRNIELDIWHELKREVKSAGWNRYSSNELQVGGKCLIEISVNDLEQCDGNNNRNIRVNNSLDCAASESNSNIEQQKLKQGALWLHGYIQEMNTDKEPVLVFIKDLGEKKFVPYDALKPLPVVRKNRQKSWVPINRNHTVNPDSNRRWKKSYNSFSRKRKDTIGIANVTADNTNVLINIHNDDDSGNVDSVNNINKSDFETDEHNEKFSKTEEGQISENNSAYSNDTSNEDIDCLSTALVTLDNSKSTTSNNAVQEAVDKHRKTDAVFRKANNTAKNKTEKYNNFGNGNKNSCSKPKALDENYCPTYNGNSQMLVGGNMNVSYIAPDNNNMYTIYSYPPGNFGEQTLNQVDHSITSSFFYNLHLLHIEDSFRLNPTYYGPMMYGPGHHGVQPVGALPNAHVPYIQEEMERLVNGMQNLSLTCGEGAAGASAESCNASHMNVSGMQTAGQPKQGPKISNGKDFLCQVPQKGKQTGTAKGNKARNRQQNPRGPAAYTQHSNYQYGATMMSGSRGNAYDARRHDMHVLQSQQQQQQQQQQHHWDPSGVHQMASMATNPSNSYPPPNMCPNLQYHELSPPYEGGVGNSAYYLGNGNYIQSVPYLSAQHVENAAENAAVPSYPQHFYPTTENYPSSHPLATGQPMMYAPPMIYPPPIQYHTLPPPPHVQEQWNPTTLGPQTYVQCPAQQPIVEPSSNGQVINPNGSP